MIAYFDCFSGISGDMTLGAFIQLGVDVDWLKKALSDLPFSDFDIRVSEKMVNGISAAAVDVLVLDKEIERDYSVIRDMIADSPLSNRVKKTSLEMFHRLAAAEAKVHGRKVNHVHFHEVGGQDAIVDMVGTALCMEHLNIEWAAAPPLPLGWGMIHCRHGRLPAPAPASLEILKQVPVRGVDLPHELVTPTGAAIVTTFCKEFGPMPAMTVEKTGYGAGQKDLSPHPNLLRVVLGRPKEAKGKISGTIRQQAVLLETNIDDMPAEWFGFLMDRLFEAGALDVWWVPAYMKKNRPATVVQVLCLPDGADSLAEVMFTHSSTLGVRRRMVWRDILARRMFNVSTLFGDIAVKAAWDPGGAVRIFPEYESCKKAALAHDVPLKQVVDAAMEKAGHQASSLAVPDDDGENP